MFSVCASSLQLQQLDEFCQTVLHEAGIAFPPVDMFLLARRLGMEVIVDAGQPHRAQFVRLSRGSAARGLIVLGQAPRRERMHWAVAHEIGESLTARAAQELGCSATSFWGRSREQLANELAKRLLLPFPEFIEDGERWGWELPALKARYATASHEVIARRMLDAALPVMISIIDNGVLGFRGMNVPGRVPPLSRSEEQAWQEVQASGRDNCWETAEERIQVWAVHEPAWKREIIRTQAVWMEL